MTLRNRNARPRPLRALPPPPLRVALHQTNTSFVRETLLTPPNGQRLSIVEVHIIQEKEEGTHFGYELYFGTGEDIDEEAQKAIYILDVPPSESARTPVYQGQHRPIGGRNEPLSGRWTPHYDDQPPANQHIVVVEYNVTL